MANSNKPSISGWQSCGVRSTSFSSRRPRTSYKFRNRCGSESAVRSPQRPAVRRTDLTDDLPTCRTGPTRPPSRPVDFVRRARQTRGRSTIHLSRRSRPQTNWIRAGCLDAFGLSACPWHSQISVNYKRRSQSVPSFSSPALSPPRPCFLSPLQQNERKCGRRSKHKTDHEQAAVFSAICRAVLMWQSNRLCAAESLNT